ncbi:F5/8 type C domain protein [Halalkalibacter wakoensis JCM 9140]|uniref:F5/8 type C domain protein n=1 Tax=Halalkalibacter wakoensis JCM 9140 TaxID=1236970 RepID=W4Q554_9BACI|nr:discoidin domain-containing protein [Halalkalibacter wakoensis]GAE26469.1 F5/8 type C domain protein [Halalkalibacter wakoensis JCM 9140]
MSENDKRKIIKNSLDDHVFRKHRLSEMKKQEILQEVQAKSQSTNKMKPFFKQQKVLPIASVAALFVILLISSLAIVGQDTSFHSQGSDSAASWVASIAGSSGQPTYTVDGNDETWWTAAAEHEWIQYDLGDTQRLVGLSMNWQEVTLNEHKITIDVSLDKENWETVWSGSISPSFRDEQLHLFSPTETRYIKLSIEQDPGENPIQLSSVNLLNSNSDLFIVTASDTHNEHIPSQTTVGDLTTRWSAEGSQQWIQYELESNQVVEQVGIAWHDGDERKASFQIELSEDGVQWHAVYTGESSGNTRFIEAYQFEPTTARYIRIVNNGNTVNNWNSITQVLIR